MSRPTDVTATGLAAVVVMAAGDNVEVLVYERADGSAVAVLTVVDLGEGWRIDSLSYC